MSPKLVRRTECSSLSLGRCSWCMKSRSWSTVASRGVQRHRNWEKLSMPSTPPWWRWVWTWRLMSVGEGVTHWKENGVKSAVFFFNFLFFVYVLNGIGHQLIHSCWFERKVVESHAQKRLTAPWKTRNRNERTRRSTRSLEILNRLNCG